MTGVTDVLVVAPHPDDDVIGCGGSIAQHVRDGARVTVVVVIGRERSALDDAVTDAEFAAETQAAAKALGVHRCIRLDEPSRDFTLSRRVHLDLVRVLREVRPQVVYLPHDNDDDVEHRMVHQLTTEALWMAQSEFFQESGGRPMPAPRLVLGYEVWAPMARFQYAQNIDGQIETKVEAMRAYVSQLRHAAWDEGVRGLARYRGTVSAGSGHAEVFQVLSLRTPPAAGGPDAGEATGDGPGGRRD
ncbi:PIG-L deacetylase family protein [Streptomyces incarnatus]|uniref:PIG-L deacetylase family protein n=1 Tax=unclassified Streptomyces TaxID=2593676 RepID=UPI001F16C036|nr:MULTISPECIES: PIG-L deacetylase family protein [unclassified Streptomyces]WKE68527.1 PIG-L family deacetylase [Streptomyces sp. WP-1]